MMYTNTTYVTDFSKRLVYACIQNSDEECMFNYTYKELLIDMYIMYQSQTYNHKKISVHLLSDKYKLLFIMYSIIYNQTIYVQLLKNDTTIIQLTDIDIINVKDVWLEKKNIPDNILEIYNDSLHESYLHINSLLIHYKQDIEYKTDWEDIRLFSSEYSTQFISTLHKKKNIYISNLNEIYFIYFIPIAIILNKKLIINKEDIVDIHDTLTIGDHTSTEHKDILIMNKYSNTIDIHYNNSIFFNYTINQFIIHTIKLKKTYMVGTLFSYISIKNNILYYKNYTLQVPKTYILDKNILYIKKKHIVRNTQAVTIYTIDHKECVVTDYNRLQFRYKSKRLLSIGIETDVDEMLTNRLCKRLYRYLLYKYPYCTHYNKYSNLKNIYLYNNESIHDDFINNSLFSINFLIKKKKIVISYSDCIHNYIQYIILELNNILHKKNVRTLLGDNKIIEYVLGHYEGLRYIFSDKHYYKMNMITFLKTFGFCKIKAFHVYSYTYYNKIWNKKDLQNMIHTSKHIKTNPKSLNFGNHMLVEFELDIGVTIVMERAQKLYFYVREHFMTICKKKHIKLKKINTYTQEDNINQRITMTDLFINVYSHNSQFLYFSNAFNCAHLSLLISKILLKNNLNEYIKLQNKLQNTINNKHIMECIATFHKKTDQIYKYIPYTVLTYIIQNFSTKLLDSTEITKQILHNIKGLSTQNTHYIDTILTHTNSSYEDIGAIFKYNYEYEKKTEMVLYPEYLHIHEQIKYICSIIIHHIIVYFKYKKKIEDVVVEKTKTAAISYVQLKYILTKKDMKHIYTISNKLHITQSQVVKLFLLKVFGLYFKHYYYMIREKNHNYIIPCILESNNIKKVSEYITLCTTNKCCQHKYFDYVMKIKEKKGYIFNEQEKYISITELDFLEDIHNISIDRLFYNTEEEKNPIDITFMNINNIFEINVSYASNYTIVKEIFKKLFTIIELYAIQNDVLL